MYEKELGIGIFGGKFLSIGFDYVDKVTGKTAASVFSKPSTWLNIGGGALLSALPFFIRMDSKMAMITQSAGFVILSKAVDYLEEIMGGATTGSASFGGPVFYAPPAPKPAVSVTGGLGPKFSLDSE